MRIVESDQVLLVVLQLHRLLMSASIIYPQCIYELFLHHYIVASTHDYFIIYPQCHVREVCVAFVFNCHEIIRDLWVILMSSHDYINT